MKTITTLLILIGLMIVSCDYESYLLQEEEIKIGNIYDYDFKGSEEIPELKNADDAIVYVRDNFIGVFDSELYHQKEYWATPEEFYKSKLIQLSNLTDENNQKMKGDCEDISLFLAYLLTAKLGYINVKLIELENYYPGQRHIILYFDNQYLEPQTGNSYSKDSKYLKSTIIHEISYSEALWMTINYHSLVGKYR
jgi:hypothetical protein